MDFIPRSTHNAKIYSLKDLVVMDIYIDLTELLVEFSFI